MENCSGLGEQLVLIRSCISGSLSVISDLYIVFAENLYILYTSIETGGPIKARKLNSNGLQVSSEEETTLLEKDLPWETDCVSAPWHFRRGQYHYLFYSECVTYCDRVRSVSVARSTNALGPYEKFGKPIMPDSDFPHKGHTSVVKHGKRAVMVFYGWLNCTDYVIMFASVIWGYDQWPYVLPF